MVAAQTLFLILFPAKCYTAFKAKASGKQQSLTPCVEGPWKYEAGGEEFVGCANPEGGKWGLWCATEVDDNGVYTKYYWCNMEIDACNPEGEVAS